MAVVSLLCESRVSQSVLFFRSVRHFPSVAARVLVGAESDESAISDDLKRSRTFKCAHVWSQRSFKLYSSRTSR